MPSRSRRQNRTRPTRRTYRSVNMQTGEERPAKTVPGQATPRNQARRIVNKARDWFEGVPFPKIAPPRRRRR